MRKTFLRFGLFVLCAAFLQAASVAVSDKDFFAEDFFASVLREDNIVALTNESRVSQKLPKLAVSPKLEAAARQKAEDMLNNQYFAHNAPSGKTPWDFLSSANYSYLFAGENLAMNFSSSEEVLRGWLTSSGHRENILNENYSEIGVAVARGTFLNAKTTVVVQMFAKPLPLGDSKKKMIVKKRTIVAVSPKASRVKGISIEQYVSESEQQKSAVWTGKSTLRNIFGNTQGMISATSVFQILSVSFVGFGLFLLMVEILRMKKRKSIRR